MNKKAVFFGLMTVLIILTISLTSAVKIDSKKETKMSPLYTIRTKRANSEKFIFLIEKIKTSFLGERIFFIPLRSLANIINDRAMESVEIQTCPGNPCTFECTQYKTSCPTQYATSCPTDKC